VSDRLYGELPSKRVRGAGVGFVSACLPRRPGFGSMLLVALPPAKAPAGHAVAASSIRRMILDLHRVQKGKA
jgi:hypothetical protein